MDMYFCLFKQRANAGLVVQLACGVAYGMVEAASSGMLGSIALPFQDQNGGPGEKQTRLSTTSLPFTQYMT